MYVNGSRFTINLASVYSGERLGPAMEWLHAANGGPRRVHALNIAGDVHIRFVMSDEQLKELRENVVDYCRERGIE